MNNTKDRYYRLMQEVEQSEIAIEQALIDHEKGQMTLE